MVVRFEKCELKIDQIHKEEFSPENFVEHEIKVIELIQGWLKNDSYFEFETSGSTGKAKTIAIAREKIEYSCKTTLDKLDPHSKFKSALLCINPKMVGGAMVVFRAIIRELDLWVLKPSSNPFQLFETKEKIDVVSLVPLQMHNATVDQLDRFDSILVGGGHYSSQRHQNSIAKIYSTFGMTETVSHFALRPIEQAEFECIGDTAIENQKDGRLAIRGTLTNHKLLITNDLIEFITSKRFKWIGRSDFVINTGGIKINPEEIENKLENLLDRRFIVSFLEDTKLENKVILILEGEPFDTEFDFHSLERYLRPKEIHFVESFVLTSSQKIDRIKTRNLLLESLNQLS